MNAAAASATSAGQSATLTLATKLALEAAIAAGNPLGVIIPDANATFATIGAAVLANVPLIVKAIRTQGFYSAGDGGDAFYKRVATDPGIGAGCFRSADRFLPDGSMSAANGGWWVIVVVGGFVYIAQFGGRGDSRYDGSPLTVEQRGTDNWQPLNDALKAIAYVTQNALQVAGPKVVFGLGSYWFSQTVNLKTIATIEGRGTGSDNFNFGTNLIWTDPDADGLIINGQRTFGRGTVAASGSAQGSIISGVNIVNLHTTSRASCGLRPRTLHRLRDVYVQWLSAPGVGGDAIYCVAQAGAGGIREGNCNGSTWDNVVVRAGGYGVVVGDKDCNAMRFTSVQVRTCGYGGIYERGTLGNAWKSPRVDECATASDAGYARGSNGLVYMLISDVAGAGSANDPTTSPAIWHAWTDWPNFPAVSAWSSAANYVYSPAIGAKGGITCQSNFDDTYMESYLGDLTNTGCLSRGGQSNWAAGSSDERGRPGYGRESTLGYGQVARESPTSPYYSGSPYTSAFRARLGGRSAIGVVVGFGYDVDSYTGYEKTIREDAGDTVFDFGAASFGSNASKWLRMTGLYSLRTYGAAFARPYSTAIEKLLICDVANPLEAVQDGVAVAIPTTGIYRRGDYLRNRLVAIGAPRGWGCSVGGAKGNVAWAAGQIVYGRFNIRTNGGNAYVNVNAPARVAGATYAVGDMFSVMGKDYQVTVAGTTSTVFPGRNGFGQAIIDGTCTVKWMNALTAGATGPTGTSTTVPVRDGDIYWQYQPPFVFIPDVPYPA